MKMGNTFYGIYMPRQTIADDSDMFLYDENGLYYLFESYGMANRFMAEHRDEFIMRFGFHEFNYKEDGCYGIDNLKIGTFLLRDKDNKLNA
jgi:hypothetical protein